MKLSLVFELLLIFVLLAFAASKSIKNQKNNKKAVQDKNDDEKLEENSINKYCRCAEAYCNCCRDFALPLVNLNGPGCASLMYQNGDKMSVSLSFGKKVITNRTLSSRKPSPVCMPLPGGISKFCGRVYNIARSGEEFRACLGLELQSKRTVEAAVRVSCFKFGPRGVHTEPADPLPLVPQDEKGTDDDDEDDDDDDDDDFDLGDDDEDDEADLDGLNDVDSADYTGFSLLGEDILGDLFGSSNSDKKKNNNKIKKKQAPAPSTTTTTTTTRRPRPSRRPTRRPVTRTTTPRPTRVTTAKVRPASSRRPIRRPSRRPNRPTRRPTTSITAENPEQTQQLVNPTTPTEVVVPVDTSVLPVAQSTERIEYINSANDEILEPVVIVTQKPSSTLSITTPKPITDFEDPGIEMSLAHITGQLSAMPVSPIVPENAKDGGMMTTSQEQISYEKIETITPKATTISFTTTSEEKVSGDMIQIVQNLDSNSEENVTDKEVKPADESRGHGSIVSNDFYEGLSLAKRNHDNQFNLEDLDVLHLTEIGETVGDQIGIFGGNKRQNRNNKDNKVNGSNKENIDYDILGLGDLGESVGKELGLIGKNKKQNKSPKTHGNKEGNNDYDVFGLENLGESLGIERSDKTNGKNKKERRRQNKMMRGEWSHV